MDPLVVAGPSSTRHFAKAVMNLSLAMAAPIVEMLAATPPVSRVKPPTKSWVVPTAPWIAELALFVIGPKIVCVIVAPFAGSQVVTAAVLLKVPPAKLM